MVGGGILNRLMHAETGLSQPARGVSRLTGVPFALSRGSVWTTVDAVDQHSKSTQGTTIEVEHKTW